MGGQFTANMRVFSSICHASENVEPFQNQCILSNLLAASTLPFKLAKQEDKKAILRKQTVAPIPFPCTIISISLPTD